MPDLAQIRATLAEIDDPVALLESLFAFAPVGLQIFEASGRSILVNQAFLDLFGSEPPPGYNVLHDEIAAERGILDLIRRAFAGETIHTPPIWYDPRELSHVEVDVGNRVAMSASFVPLRNRTGAVGHVAVVFEDLTSELAQREQLEEERELLAAIVDQVGEGIVMADDQGTLRLANRVAQELGVQVGTPLERWARSRLFDIEGSPLPSSRRPLLRALQGETVEAVVRQPLPDGSVRALNAVALPLRRPDGSLRGAVATFRDETDRVQREAAEKQAAHFRERFIGILGHDLRSPLTAILANAALVLRQSDVPDVAVAAAARIKSSAERMSRMISEVLDFTQARLGGGIPLHRRATDLGEIARAVTGEVSASNPDRAIDLGLEGDLSGSFDPDRAAQLLSNLLENAVAYAPANDRIRVGIVGREEAVEIVVDSAGAPIPEEERAALFDPFRRGARSSDSKGLGLGLYIVQQIARAHGGDVVLECGDGRVVIRAVLQR
ncbi:MAG TPA: ATP-binding protein [Myxococcales bacterium]|nr:ATP-binding protein [Myxococcales bacterium]